MRIFVLTMDDPVYTNPFLKEVIAARKDDIVGVCVPEKGSRLTIGKQRSKLVYLFSLLLIMGPRFFVKNSFKTVWFKTKKRLSSYFALVKSPSILAFADDLNIPNLRVRDINDKKFLDYLRSLNPDIIINQSQNILKKELLSIPNIGTLNRDNALLPKNRGRLTPFWVLYKGEKKTGVSIHFVDEGIDSGEIVIQKEFEVGQHDNFYSIVEKNYQLAPKAMLEAIDKLEAGQNDFQKNDDEKATYNTVPTLGEALRYRLNRLKHIF